MVPPPQVIEDIKIPDNELRVVRDELTPSLKVTNTTTKVQYRSLLVLVYGGQSRG